MENNLIELFTNPKTLYTYYFSKDFNIIYRSNNMIKVTDLNGRTRDVIAYLDPVYELKKIKKEK